MSASHWSGRPFGADKIRRRGDFTWLRLRQAIESIVDQPREPPPGEKPLKPFVLALIVAWL